MEFGLGMDRLEAILDIGKGHTVRRDSKGDLTGSIWPIMDYLSSQYVMKKYIAAVT